MNLPIHAARTLFWPDLTVPPRSPSPVVAVRKDTGRGIKGEGDPFSDPSI